MNEHVLLYVMYETTLTYFLPLFWLDPTPLRAVVYPHVMQTLLSLEWKHGSSKGSWSVGKVHAVYVERTKSNTTLRYFCFQANCWERFGQQIWVLIRPGVLCCASSTPFPATL